MTTGGSAELKADEDTLAFHERAFVFDALSLYYVLDEPYTERLLEGGVNGTNVTFAVEEDWEETLKNIERGLQKIEDNPIMVQATSFDDLIAAQESGKLAVVLGTQGASMIDKFQSLYTASETSSWKPSFERLEILHRLGFRFFGLTYTAANLFADGCGEKRNAGVSYFGEELIDCVNGLEMILDLSHTGHQSRAEAAALARAPVCTHSNAYSIMPSDRNTKDETVKAMADKGGAIGIVGFPRTIDSENPSVERMVDHLDYLIDLVGEDHVGIGNDFTEAYQENQIVLPESRRWRTLRPDIFGTVEDFTDAAYPLKSIRFLPNLTQAMFDRGYTKERVAKVLGGVWLRVFKTFVG